MSFNIVISLGGKSQRFFDAGFIQPKYYLPMADGKTMIEHAIDTLNISGNLILIVQKIHCEKYNIDKLGYFNFMLTSSQRIDDIKYYTNKVYKKILKEFYNLDIPENVNTLNGHMNVYPKHSFINKQIYSFIVFSLYFFKLII